MSQSEEICRASLCLGIFIDIAVIVVFRSMSLGLCPRQKAKNNSEQVQEANL
jgi:hypothetical protein